MPSVATAAIVSSVIAAGVSAYGIYAQGQSQKAISNFNAQEQQRQAQEQMRMMQAQAELQRQQANSNFMMREAEVEARMNNARAMHQRVLQQDSVEQINARKRADDFQRMQSDQRSAIANSGVAEASGTPLDLIAETAAKIRLDRIEQKHVADVNRVTLLNHEVNERLGGKLALIGATLDRDSLVSQAAFRDAAAHGAYLAGMREAEISRLTGSAAAQAGTYQAAGTLLSGFSSAGDMYMRRNPPKANSGTASLTAIG
jgi:hypothetical protein